MTEEQANNEIAVLRNAFNSALKNFRDNFDKYKKDRKKVASLTGELVHTHTELLNKISECIGQLNITYNFFESKNLQHDFEATTKNFLETSFKYYDLMTQLSAAFKITRIIPSAFAYNTIQNFINTFSSKQEIHRLKTEFESRKLSIDGFNKKIEKPMTTKTAPSRKTSIWVGAISILVVFAILILKNNLSEDFRMYLRILFALGIGGLSAALIGGITVKLPISLGISAIGGFAVFIVIFFFVPLGFKAQDTFSATINLQDKNGNPVYADDIHLHVKFENGTADGQPLPSSNGYEFNPVAGQYLKRKVELQLSSAQWTFANRRRTDSVLLKQGNENITILRDTSSLQLYGNVSDSHGNLGGG